MIPKEITAGFFRRSLIASIIMALLAALFIAVYAGFFYAGAYLAYVAWSLSNLLVWGLSLRELLGPRRPIFMIPLFMLKFLWIAIIFGLCYLIGIKGWGRFLTFLLGFTYPFYRFFSKSSRFGVGPAPPI